MAGSMSSQAQISGKVMIQTTENAYPANDAYIRCISTDEVVIANENGEFMMPECAKGMGVIIAHVSAKLDTFFIDETIKDGHVFYLSSGNELTTATVESKRQTYGISSLDAKTTINLGEREFQKAACCNLSESFENAPAIDVSFGDALTGTRQIKMLGLDGVYTMMSREFMPGIRGINSYYGMSFVPAAWIDGIQITKGAGSVVNGYESMAGQINLELKKPYGKEVRMFDQFVSESGRSETDLMANFDLNSKLATSVFIRSAFRPTSMDRNSDGFLDNPLEQKFQAMNRWQFNSTKGYEGQFSMTYTNDHKEGGQTSFVDDSDPAAYGIDINNEQFDVWAKLGKTFKDKPYQSFGSQYGFSTSSINSTYGNSAQSTHYKALGKTYYVNVMFQSILKTTLHNYKMGVSALHDDLQETYQTKSYDRNESVIGAFGEYTFSPNHDFDLVLGARTDYNSIYGMSVTPRIHIKKRLNKDKTTIRLSSGMGRRTANIYAEHQYIFASARVISIDSTEANSAYGLKQEVSINSGISLNHKFKFLLFPAELITDFFYTQFFNEVVVDREASNTILPGPGPFFNEARFYNMENGTKAKSFQIQLDVQPRRRTELRFAYRMFDVTTDYKNYGTLQKPFVAKHRGFINVTQSTRNKWQFSSTFQIYGPQRVAGGQMVDELYVSEQTPVFTLLNFQVSKDFKKNISAYIGVENILNYRQDNPIIGANTPFATNFDASMVWGPIFGRMVYGGFRWRIKRPEKA